MTKKPNIKPKQLHLVRQTIRTLQPRELQLVAAGYAEPYSTGSRYC